jgi:hypothetical protein
VKLVAEGTLDSPADGIDESDQRATVKIVGELDLSEKTASFNGLGSRTTRTLARSFFR